MKYYLGVTDNDWFNFLAQRKPEDINFWQPSGKTSFKALKEGGLFVFKLKNPVNAIGGVGFFSSHSILPLDVAWNIFKERNGVDSFLAFKSKIINYRNSRGNSFRQNPNVGCIVLTDPIFFDESDWIQPPQNWSKSIVQGKGYSTRDSIGHTLWVQLSDLIQKYRCGRDLVSKDQIVEEPEARYGQPQIIRPRLGQGAFRVQITDLYSRRCAVSGEKTLPVLEAAHIKSYAESGPNRPTNGILLRADMHKLYDTGYMTFTKDLKVEVSRRIKEEFKNGRNYYEFHGQSLLILPSDIRKQPDPSYIEWHNNNIYNG